MEMCYDGTLVMPSSYAVMDEEEMTYVEWGIKFSKTLTGYKITLSARNCGDLVALAAAGSVSMSTVSAVLGLSGVGITGAIALAIAGGVVGVGSAYMWLCSNHNGATMRVIMVKNVYLGHIPPIIRW